MTNSRVTLVVFLIALVKFALHLFANGGYGYFRDELYYIACGEHLDWGYIDHPPLIPLIAKLSRMFLGDSLRALRFVPALASSVIVLQGAAVAQLMGAGSFARILTAVCIAGSPVLLSDGSLLTTNCLEPMFWLGCVYFAIRAVKENQPKWWLCFGAVGGLGLQDKYSIGIFLVAISAGLLLTGARQWLLQWSFWAGVGLAFLIFLPNVIWNFAHHWPFLELMRNIKADGRDVVLPPAKFVAEQILLMHPLSAPVWVAGLFCLFFWKPLGEYRFVGWAYVGVFAFFEVTHGKNYYLAPAYPMLLAAGSVCVERVVSSAWVRAGAVTLLVATQLALAPVVVPVLAPERLAAYLDALPFEVPRTEVSHSSVALPQHYADQFGWRELAQFTAQAWSRIPEADRADCAIFGQNYGQAGAIDFFGRGLGLPPAISGHQSYYLWGPRSYSGNCLLVTGDRKAVLETLFESVEPMGITDAPYALEPHIPVFLCRRAKFGTLQELWPRIKKWR